MAKIYSLLRNNQQSGPFTLDEILSLQLKPFDLVWVEGRSAAWQYPGEVEALKPFVGQVPQAENPFQPIPTSHLEESRYAPSYEPQPARTESRSKIFVSMPTRTAAAAPVEKPLASEPLASPAYESRFEPLRTEEVRPPYESRQQDTGDDYANILMKSRKQKQSFERKKLIAGGVVGVGLLASAFFFFQEDAQPSKPQVQAPPVNNVSTSPADASPAASETASALPAAENVLPVPLVTEVTKRSAPRVKSANQKLEEPTRPDDLGASQSHRSTEPIQANETVSSPTPSEKPGAAEPKQKKKLGDVVKKIFGKNKKEETVEVKTQQPEPVLDEPRPATNRQATRRSETETTVRENATENKSETPRENPAVSASLAGQIELSSNAPDNWMMGVKGLKVTLRNRSNVAVQTAAVDVLYYDESNQLLEKKMIYFNNVSPKGKMVVGAPDHKYADHIELKLAAVSAKEDRYAKQ